MHLSKNSLNIRKNSVFVNTFMNDRPADLMEKIISLAKRRGFVFPGSEIYGGLANSWDYAPYGAQLKKNIKDHWWKFFVESRDDMVGLDAAIVMNSKVWEASGHIVNFSDPLIECSSCHSRFRADQLVENQENFSSVQKEVALKIVEIMDSRDSELKSVRELLEVAKDFGIRSSKSNDDRLKKIYNDLLDEASNRLNKIETETKRVEFLIGDLKASEKYYGFVVAVYLNRFVACKVCSQKKWDIPKPFNLMLKTFLGPTEDGSSIAYLRPETAQAMFVDFAMIQHASRKKLPFGVAQIGKAFRNEITPGNFIFRTREFEQMEIEYFFDEKKSDWKELFDSLKKDMEKWMQAVGIDPAKTHAVDIPDGERAHYSKRTIDFEFDYPFGQKELFGLAYRGDYDMKQHEDVSGQELRYLDPDTNEKVRPHVIEPSLGVDRAMLAILLSAFEEQNIKDDVRTVLHLKPVIAPVQVAVFPLLKNKPELVAKAREVYDLLRQSFRVEFDDNGNVGKRYRRQDEIGTPYCITIDFDTIGVGDNPKWTGKVTVRDRDSMKQKRVSITSLKKHIQTNLK